MGTHQKYRGKYLKKQPKQERSKQIVDSILGAATRILSKMRLRDVTTNKVAELAGVGIGSLYDYFPNKNSIVTSLIDRRVDSVVLEFKNLMLKDFDKSLEEKIEEVVEFLKADFIARRDFLREIFFLAPETGRMEALYRARTEVSEVISTYLQRKFPALEQNRADQKSFVLVHSVLGLVESYIMIAPPFFKPEEFSVEVRRAIRFLLLDGN